MGRAFAFALAPLRLADEPDEYVAAVRVLRSLCDVTGAPYARPPRDRVAADLANVSSIGSKLVLPPEERLVAESLDPFVFIAHAKRLWFPQDDSVGPVDRQLEDAIEFVLRRGEGIACERGRRCVVFSEVAESLRPLATRLAESMPPHVYWLCKHVNIPMMCACIDAMGWPDVHFPRLFHSGFPVAGDGSPTEPGVADSGLFRPVATLARYSLAQLHAGVARAANGARLKSSVEWLRHVEGTFAERAESALASGGSALAAMRAAWLATEKEVCPRDGGDPTMLPGMTRRQLERWAKRTVVGGTAAVRVTMRFAIEQGLRADGSVKWRAIDDAKASGINGATSTWETIYCINFLWPLLVCRAFYHTAARLGVRMPRLHVGLDDLRHAYRVVPVQMLGLAVVALWSFSKGCTMYHVVPGHSFGLLASVINFGRLPHLVCAICVVMFGVNCTHYCDDYINVCVAVVTMRVPGPRWPDAQDVLRLVHRCFGLDIEMSKRQANDDRNVVLGVDEDISDVAEPDGAGVCQPTKKRVDKILSRLHACRAAGLMPPRVAAELRGMLGFTLQAVYGRVGRAATQPLLQRELEADDPLASHEWTLAMTWMLAFFSAILPRLPPLRVPMAVARVRPVLVWTDASFHWVDGVPSAVLGYYVYHPVLNVEVWGWRILPFWFYSFLSPDLETYIMQAELIAAISVYFSLPHYFRGMSVIHWIDNTGALSALINGAASKEDCAMLVSILHAQMVGLRVLPYYAWIPTKANVADLPTRIERRLFIPPWAIEMPFHLPPVEEFLGVGETDDAGRAAAIERWVARAAEAGA